MTSLATLSAEARPRPSPGGAFGFYRTLLRELQPTEPPAPPAAVANDNERRHVIL